MINLMSNNAYRNSKVIIKGGDCRVFNKNDSDRILLRQRQIIPTQYKQFHASDLQV